MAIIDKTYKLAQVSEMTLTKNANNTIFKYEGKGKLFSVFVSLSSMSDINLTMKIDGTAFVLNFDLKSLTDNNGFNFDWDYIKTPGLPLVDHNGKGFLFRPSHFIEFDSSFEIILTTTNKKRSVKAGYVEMTQEG